MISNRILIYRKGPIDESRNKCICDVFPSAVIKSLAWSMNIIIGSMNIMRDLVKCFHALNNSFIVSNGNNTVYLPTGSSSGFVGGNSYFGLISTSCSDIMTTWSLPWIFHHFCSIMLVHNNSISQIIFIILTPKQWNRQSRCPTCGSNQMYLSSYIHISAVILSKSRRPSVTIPQSNVYNLAVPSQVGYSQVA